MRLRHSNIITEFIFGELCTKQNFGMLRAVIVDEGIMKSNNTRSEAILDLVQSDLVNAQELNEALASATNDEATPHKKYRARFIETPLGAMLAIADNQAVWMLEFFDRPHLADEIRSLFGNDAEKIAFGETVPLTKLEQELKKYFAGRLTEFTTTLHQTGTAFQKAAWSALCEIPYGETRSYQEQAHIIGRPKAHRAVANANSCNKIAVVVPCHRIIKNDGSLGGYGGRVDRKKWLLDLEKRRGRS